MPTAGICRRLVLCGALTACPSQMARAQTYLDTTVAGVAIPKQMGPCELQAQVAQLAW